MEWEEFYARKNASIMVITFGDQQALECLKQLYEAKGADVVLCALECFDPVGFTDREIIMFWEQCGDDVELITKIIANVHGNSYKLTDFMGFVQHNKPLKELQQIENLPKNALKPVLPLSKREP